MSSQNPHSLFHRLLAYNVHGKGLSHIVGIHFVSRLQFYSLSSNLIQVSVSCLPGHIYHFSNTFPLCLTAAHKLLIGSAEVKNFFFIRIFFPCIFSLHPCLPPVICFSELSRFYYNFLLNARQGLLLPSLSYIMGINPK